MRASIVNVCSRVGVVKVNKWFTLRAGRGCGTPKTTPKRSFRSDRQHFKSFRGAGDSASRSGETLDGLSLIRPLSDSGLWRFAVCDSIRRELHARPKIE
ncbi:hypothetical protein, partial [Mesorhizobium sp. M1E.F.Ca.ET.041.01.1.1]|uniref:hypothetical protein n=1 Tax=Mesorhizobium sp. M1E.F.Ca.ET.041.01.1.1 TaxID=2496759 RepID=UPI001AEC8B94